VHGMYCMCDEMQSAWGSFLTAVQIFNAHTMRMFHRYPKPIWLLRQHTLTSHLRLYTFRVEAASKNQKPIYLTISLPYRSTISSLCSLCQLTTNLGSCYSTVISLPTSNVMCEIHTRTSLQVRCSFVGTVYKSSKILGKLQPV